MEKCMSGDGDGVGDGGGGGGCTAVCFSSTARHPADARHLDVSDTEWSRRRDQHVYIAPS